MAKSSEVMEEENVFIAIEYFSFFPLFICRSRLE